MPPPGKSEWSKASGDRQFMRNIAIFAALALLAGCATFHARPLNPSSTASEFEARTLTDKGLEDFIGKHLNGEVRPWPPATWDLEMLTLTAFYYNPEMSVARARWETKEADVITAGRIPNPKAGFIPMYHGNPGGLPPWTLTFAFDIPVETAGRRGYRIAAARHLSLAALLEINNTAWHIRSRLRRRFLALYGILQKKRLLEKQKLVLSDIVGLYRQRLAAGEVSSFALTSSVIELDKTVLSLSSAKREAAQAWQGLAGSIGLPAGSLNGVNISWDGMERVNAALYSPLVRRQALLGRTDIHAELEQYEAAQSQLRLEIAKQYPDINLGPGYSWDQGDNEWSLGLTVIAPLFNHNQGPIARARAHRKEVAAQFKALQARVIGEIDAAFRGYEDSLKDLRAADSILAGLHRQLEAVKYRLGAGLADKLALLNARLEIVKAQLARLDALIIAQESVGRLEDAVQRPLNRQDIFPEKAVSYKGVKR
jgi:outer membrane protein, heavy metal efflux system